MIYLIIEQDYLMSLSNFDGDTPANCDAHLEIATSMIM